MAEIHLIIKTGKSDGRSQSLDDILQALEEELESTLSPLEVNGESTYDLTVVGIGRTRKDLDENKKLRDEQRKALGA